jgi:hypothetical protein
MKVALLVMKERRAILDHLYASVKEHLDDCTIFQLTSEEQSKLGKFLATINYRQYDRIVIFSRLKKLEKQIPILNCISGLVFIEYDACQNYMAESKYFGRYSLFYKKLPGARVISSGYGVAKKLSAEGIDSVYVSKGYDETRLYNQNLDREIEAAFLGTLKGTAYVGRENMLNEIAKKTSLLIARTNSGDEYLTTLNKIKIFVSADVGMGEYMIKNFEAMACGCLLLANDQGGEENARIGFEDMANVVLYQTADEAIKKISL